MHHLRRHRAEQGPAEAGAAVRAHDDQTGAVDHRGQADPLRRVVAEHIGPHAEAGATQLTGLDAQIRFRLGEGGELGRPLILQGDAAARDAHQHDGGGGGPGEASRLGQCRFGQGRSVEGHQGRVYHVILHSALRHRRARSSASSIGRGSDSYYGRVTSVGRAKVTPGGSILAAQGILRTRCRAARGTMRSSKGDDRPYRWETGSRLRHWLTSHLARRGVSHGQAERYRAIVMEGRVLVSVAVESDEQAEEARNVLVTAGAAEIPRAAGGTMLALHPGGS